MRYFGTHFAAIGAMRMKLLCPFDRLRSPPMTTGVRFRATSVHKRTTERVDDQTDGQAVDWLCLGGETWGNHALLGRGSPSLRMKSLNETRGAVPFIIQQNRGLSFKDVGGGAASWRSTSLHGQFPCRAGFYREFADSSRIFRVQNH